MEKTIHSIIKEDLDRILKIIYIIEENKIKDYFLSGLSGLNFYLYHDNKETNTTPMIDSISIVTKNCSNIKNCLCKNRLCNFDKRGKIIFDDIEINIIEKNDLVGRHYNTIFIDGIEVPVATIDYLTIESLEMLSDKNELDALGIYILAKILNFFPEEMNNTTILNFIKNNNIDGMKEYRSSEYIYDSFEEISIYGDMGKGRLFLESVDIINNYLDKIGI